MRMRRTLKLVLVCLVSMVLLAPSVWAVNFVGGGPYTVDYVLTDSDWDILIEDATVNLETGSLLGFGYSMSVLDGAVLNVNDCVFEAYSFLAVSDNAEVNIYNASFDPTASLVVSTAANLFNANVTIHGANFKIDGVDITQDPLPNGAIFENGKYFLPNNVVTVLDENGVALFDVPIQCVEIFYPEGPKRTYVNLGSSDGPIDVIIDIKPDSADNTINLGSLGVIPVGILSTADFDATLVDPWTVELSGAGVAVRGKGSKLLSSNKDLNGDGLLDLEVKVETENLDPGLFQDGAAVLTGQTYDGQEVQGSDTITIVPLG